MKERIRIIMETEQLTPSAFADMLEIGRAVISHILNGRNNPSLDVVTRILSKLPHVNPDWLLTGEGMMYKDGVDKAAITNSYHQPVANNSENNHLQSDLFSQRPINPMERPVIYENRKENTVETTENAVKEPIKQEIIYQRAPEKKVSRIIIYYSDNTFEVFDRE